MHHIDIITAQNVRISMEPAGMAERVLAAFLDYLLLIIYIALAVPAALAWTDSSELAIISSLPFFAYFPLMEILFKGQTLGKRVMKLKVMRLDGTQPTVGDYLIRWLFRLVEVEASIGTIGLTTLFINRRGQRLGDMAAKTTLVKIQPRARLEDTILEDLDSDYKPVFTQAGLLEDQDIQLAREVLNLINEDETEPAAIAGERMQQVLQNKMNLETELPPSEFIETVLKDYNAIKG